METKDDGPLLAASSSYDYGWDVRAIMTFGTAPGDSMLNSVGTFVGAQNLKVSGLSYENAQTKLPELSAQNFWTQLSFHADMNDCGFYCNFWWLQPDDFITVVEVYYKSLK